MECDGSATTGASPPFAHPSVDLVFLASGRLDWIMSAVAVRDALRALPTWVASAVVAAFKAVANVPPSLLARAVLASRPPTAVVRGLNVAALAAAAFFVGAFVAADFLGVGDSVSAWWIIFASWLGLFAGRVAQPLRRPAGASTDAPATA